jgi:hypothetical protein
LGLDDEKDRVQPTEIKSLEKLEIEEIFCGHNHTIAISSNPFYT